jgi:hypothetical protein
MRLSSPRTAIDAACGASEVSMMFPSDRRTRPIARAVALVAFAGMLSACAVLRPVGYENFEVAVKKGDAIQIYDALEALIAEGDDSNSDRKLAYKAVRDRNEDTAAFQFAWAALAGRYVQYKGLLASHLLKDMERHARRSIELDPDFRNGAAKRLLGTMYVVAPASMLEHGDSEVGLEMLEELVAKYPQDPEAHLFLAEAYITLNDPAPAHPHLCFCLDVKGSMRKDQQLLLDNLISDAGTVACGSPPVPVPKKHRR